MPLYELEYPKQPFSTVNRYDHQACYALETIHQIVNTSAFINISFIIPDSPFPMTLPMIGQMGSYTRPSADERDPLDLYLHGYISSRLMNLSRSSTSGSMTAMEDGLPVTATASHVDSLVLTLTPYSHNYNYRSAVLFGHATLVNDAAEKLYAMELITNSIVPGRWANTRVPPTSAEMQSTSILKMKINTGSAKIRNGPTLPSDEKKTDTDSVDLTETVWTGVVPLYSVFGNPIAGPFNKLNTLPDYLNGYLQQRNIDAKETAVEYSTKTRK